MEFLSQNKLNTTTMISVDSSTDTAQYLFDRNVGLGWVSFGYTAATATTLIFSFSAAVLTHVILQGHNLKSFSIFYDGTTTNSLFSSTTNSASSTYVVFPSITVASIHVKINSIFSGNERILGEIVMAERKLVFERNPTIADYNPMTFRRQVVHEMPDGGSTVFQIRDRSRTKLAWNYVTQDFVDSLFSIYRTALPIYFIPRPTTTGWDGQAYEASWIDNFDFRFSSNVKEAGLSGSIFLSQTPAG